MSSKPANCYTWYFFLLKQKFVVKFVIFFSKEVIPGSKFSIDPQNCPDCQQKLWAAREKNETRSERESRQKTREFVEAVSRFGRGGN